MIFNFILSLLESIYKSVNAVVCLIITSSDTLTLIICCNLQTCMICQSWETISIVYMAQTKHYFYRNGFTCSQSPRSASTHLGAKKRCLNFFKRKLRSPYTMNPCVIALSQFSSLAQLPCPTVQCGCFCDCGPKLLS